ncbi:MAG: sodium/pantothenate symporter [Succinatimonas sp.]|nr:sodium/pantothenate symporter [Succinatimonas sp.]
MSINATIYPVIFFLIILLGIGIYANRGLKRSNNFQKEYFIANRSLGGVVLAMTLVATYGSVSSFVSGPGIAWNLGYGWVVFAAPQIITGFLILGIIGKKLAVLSRKTDALTIIDIIEERFHNKSLSLLLSLVLLIFFTAMVVGQFIGGAQIFAAITGLNYKIGLILFATVTVIYTSSGFKAVVLTDTICAILMLVGMFCLGYVILDKGSGLDGITATISQINLDESGYSNNFKPNAGGALPWSLLFSAWILVGFATIGLPQSAVRCLSYKTTFDLHKAMIVATIVCGALMIGMTLLGVLARGLVLDLPKGGTDAVIPELIVKEMNPLLAGITIIGPLAATMSTVSSLLIAASSAIVRDLYIQIVGNRHKELSIKKSKIASILITITLGFISIILALYPMDIVAWVNLFAFGGLESAFLWPLVLGLFWKRMNASGALLGVIFGLGIYTVTMATGIKFLNCHNIVIGTAAGFIFSVIGAYLFPHDDEKTLRIFFPHKYKNTKD